MKKLGFVFMALVILVAACGDEDDIIKVNGPAGCVWTVYKNDDYDCIMPTTADAGIADTGTAVQPDAGQPECTPGYKECGSNVGECKLGMRYCLTNGSYGECHNEVKPVVEICDSKDNDCDGLTDEGNVCPSQPPDAGQQPEPTKLKISWQVGKSCSFTLSGCYGTTTEKLPIVCEEPTTWSALRQAATPVATYSDELEMKEGRDSFFLNIMAACADNTSMYAAMLDNQRQPVVHPGLDFWMGNNSRGWVKVSPTAILDASARPNLKIRLR